VRLGIDASNLRVGGGVTHLAELLRAARPQEHGFAQVIVWGGASTLSRLEERPWLCKVHEPLLDQKPLARLYWQRFVLDRLARSAGCALLFLPGGAFAGTFRPFVTMSRNMLPFDGDEIRRYGLSWDSLRLRLVRRAHVKTLRKADGVIFLTQHAREMVTTVVGPLSGETAMIAHGVDARFCHPPSEQKPIGAYSDRNPFRILYVSVVNMYKHQWCAVEAVAKLRQKGFPLQLELIGPSWPRAMRLLRKAMKKHDPLGNFVCYRGQLPYAELPSYYRQADAFVFASSCENLPNILLEAMAAGLPIACSRCGPMPEVAGDAAAYFDPEEPDDIAHALENLLLDPGLRATQAKIAFERAGLYSWDRCAQETFRFLSAIAAATQSPKYRRANQASCGLT
jgi:glycosyltransferase involved in cell wall biosynthesis